MRSVKDYEDEILDLFSQKEVKLVFKQTSWVIGKFLRGWHINVPEGHPDPMAFLEKVKPQIRKIKLEEEIKALNEVKFQVALKVQLKKNNLDGSEEYTNPMLCHKQEALLQQVEIDRALDQAFPNLQEKLNKWTQRGSGWVVNQVETLRHDIARYQSLSGRFYTPLPRKLKAKKVIVNLKNNE